jgi:carbon monoxide dehydrogenase subunit G
VDVSPYRHRESVMIAAPPETVWARVTDLTRMGDASPVCTGCDWDDPDTGFADGAWFTGHNVDGERTWSSRCEVVDVVPGQSFGFVNHGGGDLDLVRWGYEVEPDGDGTRLTESWAVLDDYPGFITSNFPEIDLGARLADRERTAHEGIAATLGAIKRELEG